MKNQNFEISKKPKLNLLMLCTLFVLSVLYPGLAHSNLKYPLNEVPVREIVQHINSNTNKGNAISDQFWAELFNELYVTKLATVMVSISNYDLKSKIVRYLFESNPQKLVRVIYYLKEDPIADKKYKQDLVGYRSLELLNSLTFSEVDALILRGKEIDPDFSALLRLRNDSRGISASHKIKINLPEAFSAAQVSDAAPSVGDSPRKEQLKIFHINEDMMGFNIEKNADLLRSNLRSPNSVSVVLYSTGQPLAGMANFSLNADITSGVAHFLAIYESKGGRLDDVRVLILGGVSGLSDSLVRGIYHDLTFLLPNTDKISKYVLSEQQNLISQFFWDIKNREFFSVAKSYDIAPFSSFNKDLVFLGLEENSFKPLAFNLIPLIVPRGGDTFLNLTEYSTHGFVHKEALSKFSNEQLLTVFEGYTYESVFNRFQALKILRDLPPPVIARVLSAPFKNESLSEYYIIGLAKDRPLVLANVLLELQNFKLAFRFDEDSNIDINKLVVRVLYESNMYDAVFNEIEPTAFGKRLVAELQSELNLLQNKESKEVMTSTVLNAEELPQATDSILDSVLVINGSFYSDKHKIQRKIHVPLEENSRIILIRNADTNQFAIFHGEGAREIRSTLEWLRAQLSNAKEQQNFELTAMATAADEETFAEFSKNIKRIAKYPGISNFKFFKISQAAENNMGIKYDGNKNELFRFQMSPALNGLRTQIHNMKRATVGRVSGRWSQLKSKVCANLLGKDPSEK